jgi:glycerol uptake facilitator-like aquaporin
MRAGAAQLLSEGVATFGLIGIVIAVGRTRRIHAVRGGGAYVLAVYWFTVSTSFANPAVTITRASSDTFAGIRPVTSAPSCSHSTRRYCARTAVLLVSASTPYWHTAQGLSTTLTRASDCHLSPMSWSRSVTVTSVTLFPVTLSPPAVTQIRRRL